MKSNWFSCIVDNDSGYEQNLGFFKPMHGMAEINSFPMFTE